MSVTGSNKETTSQTSSVDGPPLGYLKPRVEHASEPMFIYADQRRDEWMKTVFTVPVYEAIPQSMPSKRLEWSGIGGTGRTFTASSMGRHFIVHQVIDDGEWHFWICGVPGGSRHPVLELAQAAAQREYERLVMEKSPSSPALSVRELEWRDRHAKPVPENDLVAESVCGQYAIRPSRSGRRYLLWMPDTAYEKARVHLTVESAQIDAQRDFERRIRSVIDMPPI